MGASTTVVAPSGPIQHWLITELGVSDAQRNNFTDVAANTTINDFFTTCCDGNIIDKNHNFSFYHRKDYGPDLQDLQCCQIFGPQQGGFGPIISTNGSVCTQGVATPLASLAATNVHNAASYPVTYTSASFGSTTTGDFIPTNAPYCLYAYTANGFPTTTLTVPVASITTPPPGDWDGTLYTSTSSYSHTHAEASTTQTTSTKPTGSAAAPRLSIVNSMLAGLSMTVIAAIMCG